MRPPIKKYTLMSPDESGADTLTDRYERYDRYDRYNDVASEGLWGYALAEDGQTALGLWGYALEPFR
jgi:hypothetical protein